MGPEAPIGVFDSGVGGLNILAALRDLLPAEDLLYVGDSARTPYGPRPADEVVRFSLEIASWMVVERGVKMVVVGCNTASAVALEALARHLPVPVVGVVGAGARAALQAGCGGPVGVIGTERTIASGAFQRALGTAHAAAAACPGLVELVEAGELSGPRVRALLVERLRPIAEANVRALLLGCTHYPYVAREIREVLGEGVTLVSPAEEAAFEVRERLARSGLARGSGRGSVWIACTGDPERFGEIAARLYPEPIEVVHHVPLEALAGPWASSA
jgi:glutamate racemase